MRGLTDEERQYLTENMGPCAAAPGSRERLVVDGNSVSMVDRMGMRGLVGDMVICNCARGAPVGHRYTTALGKLALLADSLARRSPEFTL